MATLVLTAVGTAIGGPLGGALGAFVGRQADAALFGSGSREGPRLRELSVTTSSYGQPIPRHFGRMRVAGTVIWSTELAETTTKSGGGKGKPSTTTYSYSASFAVALSSTPIDRIGRIWADGNLLRGVNEDLKVEGVMRVYHGTGDNPVDPIIAADQGATTPAFRDCAYVVFEDLQLGEFGNRIPALTFEIFAIEDASVSLSQLVPQSANVSGDVILQNARGFSDEGGQLGSSLSAIDRVYPLSCVTTADGLTFESTEQFPASVPVLPEQLSTGDSENADERHKQRGEVIDREPLALRYYDEGRDYQPGIQRALGLRPEGRETVIDLPAAMTADGARQLANSNANRARWHDEQLIWRTGELDPHVGPGSIVRLPDANGYWLIRSWEWFDRGIELNLERLPPAIDSIAPSDMGTPSPPLDLVAPPTLLQAIEVPQDNTSAPSNAVMFAAASAVDAGWRGAALFVEQAEALNSVGVTDTRRCLLGHLTAEIEGSSGLIFEPNANLEIEIDAPDLAFDSTDLAGLAMGDNRLLLGSEVIQFLTAELVGGNQWRLSGLLRGRAGTEPAATIGHSVGTIAILLDDRLTALDPALVPSIAGTKIAAIGRGDTVPVFAELQNAGLSRAPLSPVHGRRTDLSNGSWELCWTRRARGAWTWLATSDVPLIEEQELYTIIFGPPESPIATWDSAEALFTISEADRADLVSTFGPGALWVRQNGTFGQSDPLHLTSIT